MSEKTEQNIMIAAAAAHRAAKAGLIAYAKANPGRHSSAFRLSCIRLQSAIQIAALPAFHPA